MWDARNSRHNTLSKAGALTPLPTPIAATSRETKTRGTALQTYFLIFIMCLQIEMRSTKAYRIRLQSNEPIVRGSAPILVDILCLSIR